MNDNIHSADCRFNRTFDRDEVCDCGAAERLASSVEEYKQKVLRAIENWSNDTRNYRQHATEMSCVIKTLEEEAGSMKTLRSLADERAEGFKYKLSRAEERTDALQARLDEAVRLLLTINPYTKGLEDNLHLDLFSESGRRKVGKDHSCRSEICMSIDAFLASLPTDAKEKL